jgi:hypothetical protein
MLSFEANSLRVLMAGLNANLVDTCAVSAAPHTPPTHLADAQPTAASRSRGPEATKAGGRQLLLRGKSIYLSAHFID